VSSNADGFKPSGSWKPKVIHLSKHCRHGNGNVHVAVDLACVQADDGRDVVFASGGGDFVPLLESRRVRYFPLAQDQRKPLSLMRSLVRLVRLCRRERPDVIHAHMMLGAVLGWVAARLSGARLVTTVHNSFDWHSALMRLGDSVVAVSEAEREHLIGRGFPADRVVTVWNAPARSPRQDFMRNDGPIELSRPCVVAVCGLHRRKGVGDLIDAFSAVAHEFPDWRLYIAGEGPDRLDLEQRVREEGPSDRIMFLGFVPAPRAVFEGSDVFVLPSLADPGSLSIGEARTAGCAIIATAVGGTPEMLGYGVAGRLVAPGAPKQLAVELRRLMSDAGARTALAHAALDGAEVFNVSRLVPDYDRAYLLAVDGRTAHVSSRRISSGGLGPLNRGPALGAADRVGSLDGR
jgi:glycosyltransferase involved in cell wall biosynthesis